MKDSSAQRGPPHNSGGSLNSTANSLRFDGEKPSGSSGGGREGLPAVRPGRDDVRVAERDAGSGASSRGRRNRALYLKHGKQGESRSHRGRSLTLSLLLLSFLFLVLGRVVLKCGYLFSKPAGPNNLRTFTEGPFHRLLAAGGSRDEKDRQGTGSRDPTPPSSPLPPSLAECVEGAGTLGSVEGQEGERTTQDVQDDDGTAGASQEDEGATRADEQEREASAAERPVDLPGELDLRRLPACLEIVEIQVHGLETREEAAAPTPPEAVYKPGSAASQEAQEKMRELVRTVDISPRLQERLMDGLRDLDEADSHLDYEMRMRRLFTLSQRIQLQVMRRSLLTLENLVVEGRLEGHRHFVTQQFTSYRSFLEGLRSDADRNYQSLVVILRHKSPQEEQTEAILDFLKLEHEVLHRLVGGLLERVSMLESCIDPLGRTAQGSDEMIRRLSQAIRRQVTGDILVLTRRTRQGDLPPVFAAPWAPL